MKRAILLLAVIFSVASSGFAQQTAKQLSLPECVDIALKNNLRVRRGIYNVETYRVNLFQAKMNFLPSLNAGTTQNFNFGRSINPVTNAFEAQKANSLNGQLTSSWLLFNGFRIQNSFRQSKVDVEAADEDLQKAKNDVIINVVTLYINVIFNKELLQNNQYQLSSSEQQLERITKQVNAGALPKSNQLTQEAQVATNEVNLINQENALNLSLLQLKQAMQVPASEQMDVIIPQIELEDLVLDATPDQVYSQSLKTMPEIRSALLKVESAQLALKAAKGNLYPRLSLNAAAVSNYSSLNTDVPVYRTDGAPSTTPGPNDVPIAYAYAPGLGSAPVYQFGRTLDHIDPNGHFTQLNKNLSQQVGFNLQIPIFNQWSSRANVQRAAIQSELARINEIEVQNTLRQTIESAYNDAYAASKTFAANQKQVNAREEAYRMVLQRFELGSANFVEKQIAENDLFQSRSDLTRAKYNFIFRKKILDFYQGKQIDY
ncbi:MAG TPA: TolC family protein [Cyclobacteriaceae bacterium]|nr:TolC family protein [Cyclobacteriaceae bacterium]